MKLIVSSNVESITGKLDPNTGYFLRAKRNKSGKLTIASCRKRSNVPHDGHWRFILMCARIAYDGIYATDVIVNGLELCLALLEAHHFVAAENVRVALTYHAPDIINLQKTFGL